VNAQHNLYNRTQEASAGLRLTLPIASPGFGSLSQRPPAAPGVTVLLPPAPGRSAPSGHPMASQGQRFESKFPFHPAVYLKRIFERSDLKLQASDGWVLAYYLTKCDWSSGLNAYPSQETVAQATGLSVRTVSTCLRRLVGRGLLAEDGKCRMEKSGQSVPRYAVRYPAPAPERSEEVAEDKGRKVCSPSDSGLASSGEGLQAAPERAATSTSQRGENFAANPSRRINPEDRALEGARAQSRSQRLAANSSALSPGRRLKRILADGREELGSVIVGKMTGELLFAADGNGHGLCPKVREILGELRPIEDAGREGAKSQKSGDPLA